MKINQLLVPIDFSPCSTNALRYAVKLAIDLHAKVTVVNGYEIPIPATNVDYTIAPSMYEDYEKIIYEKFDLLKHEIPEMNMIPIDFQLKIAFPMEVILEESKEIAADLIIMGTKGAGNNIDHLLGSNAYHVIKNATCPVLSIPENFKRRDLTKIAVGIDINEEIPSNIAFAIELAKLENATIHFIHVSDSPSEISYNKASTLLTLKNELMDVNYHFDFIKNKNSIEGIYSFLDENSMDILVLFPKKHTLYASIFNKSVSKNIALHNKTPLLTL